MSLVAECPSAGADFVAMTRSEREHGHFVSSTARSESPMGQRLNQFTAAKMDALLDSVLSEVANYYESDCNDTATARIGELSDVAVDERAQHIVSTVEYSKQPEAPYGSIASKVVFQHNPFDPNCPLRISQEIELLNPNDSEHRGIVVTHSVHCETKASSIDSGDAMISPHRRETPSAPTSDAADSVPVGPRLSAEDDPAPKQKELVADKMSASLSADSVSGAEHHHDAQAESSSMTEYLRCSLWSLFMWFLSQCTPRWVLMAYLFVLDG